MVERLWYVCQWKHPAHAASPWLCKVLPHCERCCTNAFLFFNYYPPVGSRFYIVCTVHRTYKPPFDTLCIGLVYWDSEPRWVQVLMACVHQHQAGTADKRWMIVRARGGCLSNAGMDSWCIGPILDINAILKWSLMCACAWCVVMFFPLKL